MKNNLFKYLNISYLFFLCSILNSNIILDENDVIQTPLPLPYNAQIYNGNDIEDFIRTTIEDNKQPILIFGANWCPDCRIFSGTINIPKINLFIEDKYKILYIDVLRYEINMDLMKSFGIPVEKGIPRILVFDKEKNLLNSSSTLEWTTARERTSQDIFDYFQKLAIN